MTTTSVRCGYPTRRKPDPEKPNRKKTAFGRHLERYMIDNSACRAPASSKSSPRVKPGHLMVLHATKGWRPT